MHQPLEAESRSGFIFKRSLCAAWVGAEGQLADQGGGPAVVQVGDDGGLDQGQGEKREM